jgi:hypothetical protein
MKTSQGKVLKLIQPKVTSTLPPIPKILLLAKRFVRVKISGYHLENAFYDELQTKALAHLRKHSPLLLNVLPVYTGPSTKSA